MRRTHPLTHVAFAAWIAAMLLLARFRPEWYEPLVQEDRFVEWWTFALFAAAAAVALPRVVRERRLGDLLVVLFCVVAAGEEISWGQRVVGYTPPALFLEHNAQQEANLHNLVEAFGQPKWTLIAILIAYGVAAPLAVRVAPLARLADRLRATVPPITLVPWFAAAIGILVWYPARFTGEWVEAVAGGLFLASLAPGGRSLALAALASIVVALLLERVSGITRASSPAMRAQRACASAEVAALHDALLRARPGLLVAGEQHRRLWTLWREEEVDETILAALTAVPCVRNADTPRRRAYGVDPWGTAYWVRTREDDDGTRWLEVYSFGPDRRRGDPDDPRSDDVRLEGVTP